MLTPEQTTQLKARLMADLARLADHAHSALDFTMDRDRDRIGRDSMDEAMEEETYSTQLRLHDRETFLLGKIREAMVRLEAGAIDECEECSDPIGFKRLLARLKAALGEEVSEVRASKRLRDSAVCLVAEEHGLDLRLERFLKQHSQLDKLSKRVLEINGQHELTRRMAAMTVDEAGGLQFDELAKLLLDQARIVEGEPIPDPGAFSRRMSSFLAKGLAA